MLTTSFPRVRDVVQNKIVFLYTYNFIIANTMLLIKYITNLVPNIYYIRKYLMWWPIYRRSMRTVFIIFLGVPQEGVNLKKWNFKGLRIICCGYSKRVSQDAWNIGKVISWIRSPILVKTAELDHILDIFSKLRDRIDLISFALFQASPDTS